MTVHDSSAKKPTPEELLARLQKEEQASRRGRLKLFLGFAAGVGKSYEMLTEAYRRKHDRKQDVVVGFVETHGRRGTEEQVKDIEVIPRKLVSYRDVEMEEMDLDAVIKRRPRWVVVDELAHTNVPGSKNEKRYQDVIEILNAGINVLSAMNVRSLLNRIFGVQRKVQFENIDSRFSDEPKVATFGILSYDALDVSDRYSASCGHSRGLQRCVLRGYVWIKP